MSMPHMFVTTSDKVKPIKVINDLKKNKIQLIKKECNIVRNAIFNHSKQRNVKLFNEFHKK